MISYLSGKIAFSDFGKIILDVSGIGYGISTTGKHSQTLGDAKKFYIYEHIREDCHDLYGFEKSEELSIFEKLVSVSGVGPKVGMLILGTANPEKIISAIIQEDLSFFQSISGIGKKVAAKIILDLKSKLSGLDGSGVLGKIDQNDEVSTALISLGYKPTEISNMVQKIPSGLLSAEEKIKWFIKNISK